MTNPIQSTAAPVRLLGHDFSLYSGKATAYLRHKQIPFVEDVTPEAFDGEFLDDDQVPDTLLPMLKRMFDEQLPVLVDTLRRVGKWAAEHPDAKGIPRFIGKHEFQLGDVKATRYVMPFAQWMFQRPLAHYQSLTDEQKARVDPVLDRLGGLNGMNEPVVAPLKFEDYRIRLVR